MAAALRAGAALESGLHNLGSSVIFGFNVFNLAALFGLRSPIAGGIACGCETLLLNAGVPIAVIAVLAWQKIANGSPLIAGALLAVVMLPYVAGSAVQPSQLRHSLMPGRATCWLQEAVQDAQVDAGDERFPNPSFWANRMASAPLPVMIVSSVGMVRAASDAVLGARC